jgi:hypothetical protein
LAFEAAVAILVVLTAVSVVLAAARARVTRFGGDWSFMVMIELGERRLKQCHGRFALTRWWLSLGDVDGRCLLEVVFVDLGFASNAWLSCHANKP